MTLLLSNQQLADLFAGLYRLYDAGLTPARMFAAIEVAGNKDVNRALQRAGVLASAGQSVTGALARSGLINKRDDGLLRHAEETGGLAIVFDTLSDYYQRRATRRRKFVTQLTYPIAVLVMAVFIAPVPALFTGDLSVAGYVLRTVLPLVLAIGGYSMFLHASRRRGNNMAAVLAAELGYRLPVVGGLVERRIKVDFLTTVALFLKNGLPGEQALAGALSSVGVRHLKKQFQSSLSALADGLGIAGVLGKAKIVDSHGYAIVQSAEAAGRIDSVLPDVAIRLTEELDDSLDSFATWSSRGLYLFVLLVLAAGLLT